MKTTLATLLFLLLSSSMALSGDEEYVGLIERDGRALLKKWEINKHFEFVCGDDLVGMEVLCAVKIYGTDDPKKLNATKIVAYEIVRMLAGKYPVNFSILAQRGSHPLARFFYTQQFDTISEIHMWP